MRRKPISGALILALLAALCATSPAVASPPGEQLIEAVQQQRVKAARKLLAAGADVDSATRYGATPLFFACDKGNVELVELLLEHGADVNVTDSFYNATPLGWTLGSVASSASHRRIALLLLEHGAEGAAAALDTGVRIGDLGLVEAAVASGRVAPAELTAALERAEAAGKEEIAARLRAEAPAEVPLIEVAEETLATYAGDYASAAGDSYRAFVEDGELKLEAPGEPAWTLDATAEDTFIARGVRGIGARFFGRGGLIEGFRLRRGDRDLFLRRAASESDEAVAAAAVAEPAAEPATPAPPAEVPAGEPRPWPRFRGAAAAGIGDGQGAPGRWDGESGHNVYWKTRVPGLAHSSPVIWGGRVFITTAITRRGDESLRTGLYGDVDSVDDLTRHRWQVLCLDLATGEILWRRTARRGRPKAKRHLKSTQANPTPATDGRRLVAHFGPQGIVCYDLNGRRQWRRKKLGKLSSGWFYDATYEWGFSSSPILHDGKVISQVDVHDGSYLTAYDLATGREVWRTPRDEVSTWGTPVVLENGDGGAEIVTNGTVVRGYDAASGEELWRLAPNSEITVASPVAAGGVAYVTGGYPPARPIYAVVPGGRGDLSLPEGETASDHVLWSSPRGGAYMPTPIVYRGLLYVLHNNGRLTAHRAGTGELVYRARVGTGAGFTSSPVAADGRLYFTSEEGTTYVVRAGETFQVQETNELGEVVMSTPAISGGLLVIRGAKHVYGLGETESDAAAARDR